MSSQAVSTLKTFDINNVKFGSVITTKINSFSWTRIPITYGQGKSQFLLSLPKMICPGGIRPSWPMGMKDEEKTLENASDFTMLISICSAKVSKASLEDLESQLKDDPSNVQLLKDYEEKSNAVKITKIFEDLQEKAYKHICSKEQMARISGGPKTFLKTPEGLKPNYNKFSSKIVNGEEKEYGESFNLKVLLNKKDKKCLSAFQDAISGKETKMMDYVSFGEAKKSFSVEPIIKFDNIFIGGHGTSAYGASFQIKLWVTNVYPNETYSKPSINLLNNVIKEKEADEPKNTDIEVDEDSEDEDSEDEDSEDEKKVQPPKKVVKPTPKPRARSKKN